MSVVFKKNVAKLNGVTHWQKCVLKIKTCRNISMTHKYFERGLSKSLKKSNFIFSFEPSPFQ